MRHQGGGTFISPDSVRVVARYLAEHPEGIPHRDWDIQPLISQCHEFEELTGDAGDFVILHPYMLHASSQNVLGVPRIISNPPIVLKEPMNFNRANPEDFSLLERATLGYLGVDRLDFHPTAPREAEWVSTRRRRASQRRTPPPMSSFKALTAEQVQSFLDNGYLVVKDCLDMDVAQRWVAEGFERLGYDPDDPSTWAEEIIWMKYKNEMPIRELAPAPGRRSWTWSAARIGWKPGASSTRKNSIR